MPTPQYILAALPRTAGLSGADVVSILARALRERLPAIESSQIVQVPLSDGGAGTVEHLVTSTLGSFMETRVHDATGEEIIVPIGILGDGEGDGSLAVLELRQIAEEPKLRSERTSSRTDVQHYSSFGVGEAITDLLEEGAFSIVLGWDEPLVRDAGLGLAQALGVAFRDADGNVIDLSAQAKLKRSKGDEKKRQSRSLLQEIATIDTSGRSFAALSARFYLARAESVKTLQREKQVSVDDAAFEEELARLAKIVERDTGRSISLSNISSSLSGIDFGLKAFFNVEEVDGGSLILELSGVKGRLRDPACETELWLVADKLQDLSPRSASAAVKDLLATASQSGIQIKLILGTSWTSQQISRFRKQYPTVSTVVELDRLGFIDPALSSDRTPSGARRTLTARSSALVAKLLEAGVSAREATTIVA